jgi:hypothetical protein
MGHAAVAGWLGDSASKWTAGLMSGRYVDASKKIEQYIEDKERIREKDLHRVKLVVDTDWLIPKCND